MLRVRLTDELKSALPVGDDHARKLHTITMVGGLVRGGELSLYDRMYLKTIFSVCAKKSVGFTPEPSLRVTNLEYGDDFLTAPKGADMVVFSYIFSIPTPRAAKPATATQRKVPIHRVPRHGTTRL